MFRLKLMPPTLSIIFLHCILHNVSIFNNNVLFPNYSNLVEHIPFVIPLDIARIKLWRIWRINNTKKTKNFYIYKSLSWSFIIISFQSWQLETYNVSITYQGISMCVARIVNFMIIAKIWGWKLDRTSSEITCSIASRNIYLINVSLKPTQQVYSRHPYFSSKHPFFFLYRNLNFEGTVTPHF